MPYNREIPGQVNSWQLKAIETIAAGVPRNGHVVEVGSLFGASSWTWAKSVDPSVTVHCIDPWEGNKGVRPIEERFGIVYSLDQFEAYTADCPNIRAHKGYSPRDFQFWDQKIDLYYEDAVHTDPILSENLDFWGSHLRPQGIMCGDDYRGRFPDVRGGARRKAEEMGRDLIVIENFWCLLPKPARSRKIGQLRDELLAQQEAYRTEMEARGPHAAWHTDGRVDVQQERAVLEVQLTQEGLLSWPAEPAPNPLYVSLSIGDEAEPIFEGTLKTDRMEVDIPQSCRLTAPSQAAEHLIGTRRPVTPIIHAEGEALRLTTRNVEFRADLRAPEEPTVPVPMYRVPTTGPFRGTQSVPTSREFFLQFSRQPASFGVEPVTNSFYELTRPDGTTHRVRSMLSIHEIALCYALAGLTWNGDAIVDLGPRMGASTWAFAKGVTDAGHDVASPIIHSFDLWKYFASYEGYLSDFPVGGARSVLGQWTRTLEGYHYLIAPHQGDFTGVRWDGRPIGILFVDLAKTQTLNDHVVRTMFPCLKPGSMLVQQNYVHFNEYWIHMEMARLRDYFEPCYVLQGATQFYRCVKPIPVEVCEASSSHLAYKEQAALLDEERARAIAPVQQVLKTAAAKHAIDNGDTERARGLLDGVDTSALTDNGVQEFSGIAISNKAYVEGLLGDSSLGDASGYATAWEAMLGSTRVRSASDGPNPDMPGAFDDTGGTTRRFTLRSDAVGTSPSHPRLPDFVQLLDWVQERRPGPCNILETGTMRPDDFLSTLQWDGLTKAVGGRVVTIDIDPQTSDWARERCSARVETLTGDSVATIQALTRTPGGSFDLAYLDSYDVKWIRPHDSALHHLMELTALLPHLKPGAVVAVDDNRFIQDIRTGKGLYIHDFMGKIGARNVLDGYIIAWEMP